MTMHREPNIAKRQSGAILVVGLIMLLMLTVLGVSTMNTASLELTMAGNDQSFENAFQLAETGIDRTLSDLNNGVLPPPPLNPNAPTVLGAPEGPGPQGGTYSRGIAFRGDTPDISGESSFQKIRQYHYVNESVGNLPNQDASSWHHQGLFIRGPDGL